MAITFSTDISEIDLKLAYNNNVVTFSTDSVKVVKNCEIIIGTDVFIIYPNPQGVFYYNFKDYIISEINKNNFADELNANILANGHLYNYLDSYLETGIIFKIVFTDETFDSTVKNLKWLRGVLQLEDFKSNYPVIFNLNTPLILSPLENNSNTSRYVKYFEGYPFDLSVYVGTSSNLKITNTSNLLYVDFENPNKVNRLVFSDGETDSSIDNILAIDNGYNELKFTSNNLDSFLIVEKESNCGGTYLKWINSLGGWSYWLFSKGVRQRETKEIGEVFNDYENLKTTISPTFGRGKRSKDSLKVSSDLVNETQMNLLQDLFESPKVYLFKGHPFSKNTYNDWIEISVNSKKLQLNNLKTRLNEIILEIELPERYTMIL